MSAQAKRATILVVDDIADNIDVVSNILNGHYDIKAANQGPLALKILERFDVDLILLDIMMPNMDGYEVCQRIKDNPKLRNIPIIFLTAMDSHEDEQRGFDLGAVDFISKPFSASILKARVSAQLKLANYAKELERQVQERTQELALSRLEIIERLALAAEFRDNETGNHVIRVGEYCRRIARHMGLAEPECELIALTAPLHDLGKIAISDTILLKPGRLTDEEFVIMKSHAEAGAQILAGSQSELLKAAGIIALSHHEKWDGSVYPHGLKGEDIPLYGRIVTLCDVYDALSSVRPYKDAWSKEQVEAYINELSGSQFDPTLVQHFNQVKDDFYQILQEYQDEQPSA
ncbi:Cyclic di-GMP phosphodiesterase response regulator RpfG [Marinomonas aquimarina]|uniref:Cyclic di-GMP phosphodiesterase response regulator RpfG n=1 Tax=Marinomonas aquimarina TaxID=295068 RepID=A0A1A8TR39_9GAMM|nr:HD domain-containing phosphohydrolase [Marinomonas aquimarina]SBS35660.1 Cyclic di-GMP phosphodiesterase response regulator RpfG [Marinomonas aquimarina]